MNMTYKDVNKHDNATHCHICMKPINKDKVRDHCHITGAYRGAAHKGCNLNFRFKPIIPVVFHNLRGYDSHLIMQAISKTKGEITCIPNNMEKYISFSVRKLRFIDSAQFLLASLDKLVNSNKSDVFCITNKYEPDLEKCKLLLRKGVYPYECMDSWRRFKETALPPIEKFYSKLTDENISEDDYTHAQKVWSTFGCQNMGDYHDLYLRTDTMLLADVFEKFRMTCLKHYKLDPAHYYTSPGLSWDALLKKSEVKLDLLTDYDMYLFVEKGLKGGISMVSKRHAKSNNPMVPNFDPNEKKSYIHYLDANNLYGWAMSQYLPTGGFEWVNDVDECGVQSHPDDSPKGYILEVDLKYPEEINDLHNGYLLAPERMKIKEEWMSEYQQQLMRGLGCNFTSVEK
jgi:hypothetical protein